MADIPTTPSSTTSTTAPAPKVKVPEKSVEKSEKQVQADDALSKAQNILKAHGGLEGNIGLSNEYWGLMNSFRQLVAELQYELKK